MSVVQSGPGLPAHSEMVPAAPVGSRPGRLAGVIRAIAARTAIPGAGVSAGELAALLGTVAIAAVARFANLAGRGIWDADQGTETGAIWNAALTGQLPTFGSQAFSVNGTFHHGALFYDLMIPAAWLGNGDPTLIVAEIALFGVAVVPIAWWLGRSIGGAASGLAVALLAAVAPSFIYFSTFVWNPVLVQFGTAVACLGAWEAWRTRRPAWWVVAAGGTALAGQSHLTANVLIVPMALFFVLDLRRAPRIARRRILGWGLAGAALFALTWMPVIVYELGHDFPETRAMLAFSQPDAAAANPLARVVFVFIRVMAWPFTLWPLSEFNAGVAAAFSLAVTLASGLVWRLAKAETDLRELGEAPGRIATQGAPGEPGEAHASAPEASARPAPTAIRAAAALERDGVRFISGSLAIIAVVLGLALKEASQVQTVNEEQYHLAADVFVVVAVGLVVGRLWRAFPVPRLRMAGPALAVLCLAALAGLSIWHWPPMTAPDGGWPAAQAAAARLESDAGGDHIALLGLPGFKSTDAYGYPLHRDGVILSQPQQATVVAVLCDSGWVQGCGGPAEDGLMATSPSTAGSRFVLVERFRPSPDRTLSVYRRSP